MGKIVRTLLSSRKKKTHKKMQIGTFKLCLILANTLYKSITKLLLLLILRGTFDKTLHGGDINFVSGIFLLKSSLTKVEVSFASFFVSCHHIFLSNTEF